jgi:aspartate/methionine/tyrosine aminotransferase
MLGHIEDFALERYFAQWEFAVRYQLSASDVEPLTMAELLALADPEGRARWDSLRLGYTESAGLPDLRAEIARTYSTLEARHILVVAGAEEGILLAMLASLSSDDHAVVITPAYQSLHSIPRTTGASVTMVPLLHDTGWLLNVDDVERAITRDTRILAINYPHNPTGAHLDETTMRRLVTLAADAGVLLFSDEVYRGLEFLPGDTLPAAADLAESAVSLGVMSKSYALAGLRIGWLATRNEAWLDRVARLKDYTTICSSAPSEILALIALRARDQILARSRSIVATNLTHASAFFAARQDAVEWVPPRAGSVAFPRLLEGDASELSRRLAERESALLLPGVVFGADSAHFRLGLGRKDFPVAIEGLNGALRGS